MYVLLYYVNILISRMMNNGKEKGEDNDCICHFDRELSHQLAT